MRRGISPKTFPLQPQWRGAAGVSYADTCTHVDINLLVRDRSRAIENKIAQTVQAIQRPEQILSLLVVRHNVFPIHRPVLKDLREKDVVSSMQIHCERGTGRETEHLPEIWTVKVVDGELAEEGKSLNSDLVSSADL